MATTTRPRARRSRSRRARRRRARRRRAARAASQGQRRCRRRCRRATPIWRPTWAPRPPSRPSPTPSRTGFVHARTSKMPGVKPAAWWTRQPLGSTSLRCASHRRTTNTPGRTWRTRRRTLRATTRLPRSRLPRSRPPLSPSSGSANRATCRGPAKPKRRTRRAWSSANAS